MATVLSTRALDPERDRGVFHFFEELADVDRARVRRLDDASSRAAWSALVGDGGWLSELTRTGQPFCWHEAWNAKDDEWASRVLRPQLPWPRDLPVLFLESPMWGFETTLDVFIRCWRAFLWDGEGPLLVSADRPEVAHFHPSGSGRTGRRPMAG